MQVSAAAAGAVMQGSLQLKTHRKAWVKRWFALHSDFVLYSFKCEDDDHALTATPVPGYTVSHLQVQCIFTSVISNYLCNNYRLEICSKNKLIVI